VRRPGSLRVRLRAYVRFGEAGSETGGPCLQKVASVECHGQYSAPFQPDVNVIPWENAPMRKGVLIAAVIAIGALAFGLRWKLRTPPAPASAVVQPQATTASTKAFIPYADAVPILEAQKSSLPEGLKASDPRALEPTWLAWAAQHDTDIRARLASGDEDSVVNLWLYGTTFTALPRATEQQMTSFPTRALAEALLLRRLDDLVTGLASPAANERLQFARELVERQGIDPTTETGREQARLYLVKARERVIAANARYRRVAESAKQPGDPGAELKTYSTMYQDRGLSSDTRLTADFAVDKAIEAIASGGGLPPRSVRRAAIVGPGLDFTDKAEGYDFYPQQTIQPYALVDSLTRLGLAKLEELRVTTLDLSPRVNRHLEAARLRAQAGEAYVLQLPLANDNPKHQWDPALVGYWQRFGDRIGDQVAPIPPPAVAGDVRVRAVRVRPAITLSILSQDLDIIVERLEPLRDEERFDLIVATNILVYYDRFDQALALANVSRMLRPGGFFVTNYAVSPGPEFDAAAIVTSVFFDRQGNGDTLFCYRRQ
jgi:SAM-dependent methyltransferase